MAFATKAEELAQAARDAEIAAAANAAAAAREERAAADQKANVGAAEAISAMFSQFGMQDLADWIVAQARAGKNANQVAVEVYDQPVYQKYFPAMKALRARGRAITEDQYRQVEQGYRDILAFAGLAGSAYDRPETFARLIESEVSPRELEARVADAKMVVDSTDPNVTRALREYYGITSNDLLAYALDPKGQGKDHVERLARSAVLAGVAETARLDLSRQYTESLAMDSMFNNSTEADYRDAANKAALLGANQSRLAAIEGDRFTGEDAADVALKGDAQKTLQSKRRAEREVARFSGSSGLSSGSLRRGSI